MFIDVLADVGSLGAYGVASNDGFGFCVFALVL